MKLARVIVLTGLLAAAALVFFAPPRVLIREDGVKLPASVCLQDRRPKVGNACWESTVIDFPVLLSELAALALITGIFAAAATPRKFMRL